MVLKFQNPYEKKVKGRGKKKEQGEKQKLYMIVARNKILNHVKNEPKYVTSKQVLLYEITASYSFLYLQCATSEKFSACVGPLA